jgi:hypothetical protein
VPREEMALKIQAFKLPLTERLSIIAVLASLDVGDD